MSLSCFSTSSTASVASTIYNQAKEWFQQLRSRRYNFQELHTAKTFKLNSQKKKGWDDKLKRWRLNSVHEVELYHKKLFSDFVTKKFLPSTRDPEGSGKIGPRFSEIQALHISRPHNHLVRQLSENFNTQLLVRLQNSDAWQQRRRLKLIEWPIHPS